MSKKSIDDYVNSLNNEEFENQFLSELNKCEEDFLKNIKEEKNYSKLTNDDLKSIYTYMPKKHIHGFSDNIIYLGSTIQLNDEFIKGGIFCWNKIYAKNNFIVLESADYELLYDLLESMKEAELSYKIKFIEINPYGEKTGVSEEIK
jgi:hypothetical protein